MAAVAVARATPDDLGFVSQDGYIPTNAVARKIAAGEIMENLNETDT